MAQRIVPFKITEVHGGFSDAVGTMYVEDDFLVISVRVETLGLYKHAPETIKLEFGVIADIQHEKKLFSDRITILPKRLEVIEKIPGKNDTVLTFKIKKKNREAALDLVDEVQYRQVQQG